MAGVGLLLWIERRLRGWLRTGNIALFYAIYYGIGRLWIEGLRTDSLCTNGVGGSCEGALRTAQIVSLLLIVGGLVGLYLNHRRPLPPTAEPVPPVALADRSSEMVDQPQELGRADRQAPPVIDRKQRVVSLRCARIPGSLARRDKSPLAL